MMRIDPEIFRIILGLIAGESPRQYAVISSTHVKLSEICPHHFLIYHRISGEIYCLPSTQIIAGEDWPHHIIYLVYIGQECHFLLQQVIYISLVLSWMLRDESLDEIDRNTNIIYFLKIESLQVGVSPVSSNFGCEQHQTIQENWIW